MAIKTVCPECQTVYQLADQQAGKKVRCKSCQAIFTVEAPTRQTAVRGEGSPSAGARGKSAPATMMARRPDLDALDEQEEGGQARRGPARSIEKKGALPAFLVPAMICMGLLLVVCVAAIGYLLMRDNPSPQVTNTNPPVPQPPVMAPPPPQGLQPPNRPTVQPAPQADNQPVEGQTVQTPKSSTTKPAEPSQTARSKEETKKEEKEENSGRLTAQRRERVKQATVYIRVKSPDGTSGTGSGFFGCKEAPSIILTNAHVVGMLSPDSPRPLEVEVFVNSGEANEWSTKARVLGVDRASDLAVLDIGTPSHPLPDPLAVKEAGKLNQLDEVYVFGFPYGEILGKEITIRQAAVSALRKHPKTGVLERVQVSGGIDPGNSGGPIVDNSGAVVGVSVAVWAASRQISFAIPGERVQAILSGRIADLMIQQPYYTEANKVVLPLQMNTIDPRNLIKEVGLELWTGDKPADSKSGTRPEATKQPAAQAGDSTHVYYPLKYLAPEGKASIVLPDLPAGKVYWGQARWVNSKGETHWEAAKPLPELPQPVYRKPAKLELHYTQGAKRALDLTLDNTFRISDNDDANSITLRTVAQLEERVVNTGGGSTLLNLRYRFPPSRDLILPDGKSIANSQLEQIKSEIPRYILSVMQLDRLGNITDLSLDERPLRQLALTNPQQAKQIKDFHEMVQQGLESLSVTLPANGTVNPLESWKTEHHLPIDTPGKSETGKLDVTYIYQGTRKRDGREEAVLSMDGLVLGKDNAVGGKATGQVFVDLATGQAILAETTMKLQLRALLSRPGEDLREVRVILTMNFRLQRKRLV